MPQSNMPVKTTQHYPAAQQAVSPPPSLSYAYTYNPVLEFALTDTWSPSRPTLASRNAALESALR